jgi:hypothetical protein
MAETKKRRPRPKRGKVVNWESPNWEPLLRLARVYVGEFMWMGEVQLRGGISLHLYKHYWTRRYLNLTEDGRAFFFRSDLDRSDSEEAAYQEIPEDEIPALFDRVIRRPDPEWEILKAREEREEREPFSIPGYTEGDGKGDGLDAR